MARVALAMEVYGRRGPQRRPLSAWGVLTLGYELLHLRWLEWRARRAMARFIRGLERVGRSSEQAALAVQRLGAAAAEAEKALRPDGALRTPPGHGSDPEL